MNPAHLKELWKFFPRQNSSKHAIAPLNEASTIVELFGVPALIAVYQAHSGQAKKIVLAKENVRKAVRDVQSGKFAKEWIREIDWGKKTKGLNKET